MLSYDLLNLNVKQSCKIEIANNGFLNYENLDNLKLTNDSIYSLLCFIYKNKVIQNYNLSFNFMTDIDLLLRLKILYMVQCNNLYSYKHTDTYYFVRKQDISTLKLHLYFVSIKTIITNNRDIRNYIIQKLKYNNNQHIKNYFKREYILNTKNRYEGVRFEKDDIMMRYRAIKSFDNFKAFNIKFKNIKKEGEALLKVIKSDPECATFGKKIDKQIVPFVFEYNILYKKNKKLYTPGVKYEFEKFKTEASVHYNKKLINK
jgi:hypothetical protein